MTDHGCAPAWLAALTPAGELSFLDVSTMIDERHSVRAALARQCGGYIDRVRVHTRAGWLLVYFREPRWETRPLPHNPHARNLLRELGTDIGVYRGSVLFLAEHADREAGLTGSQQQLLQQLHQRCATMVAAHACPSPKELTHIS